MTVMSATVLKEKRQCSRGKNIGMSQNYLL